MQALHDTQGCKQLNYEMLFDRQIELKIQDNITLVPELLHMLKPEPRNTRPIYKSPLTLQR